ncbi:hypothetical protein Ancab_014280 [Ancistrocladus abbreviatus]
MIRGRGLRKPSLCCRNEVPLDKSPLCQANLLPHLQSQSEQCDSTNNLILQECPSMDALKENLLTGVGSHTFGHDWPQGSHLAPPLITSRQNKKLLDELETEIFGHHRNGSGPKCEL